MDRINILTIFPPPQFSPLENNLINRIESVNPQIRVKDISNLFSSNRNDKVSEKKAVDEYLIDVDIIFGLALPSDIIQRAPNLKWVHIAAAGVDRFLTEDVVASELLITNSSGMHATQVSELVFTMMLMLAKRANYLHENKLNKVYRKYMPMLLEGKTIGVIGIGSIGREVARLAKAFNMKVIATRIHPKIGCKYADEIFSAGDLNKVLGQSDFVIVSLPFTPENKGLIGENALRAMKPGAFLINIARGAIIDEAALIRALEEGWIAGAGLDVFETEPLPVDSRLWNIPNTVISPHIGGARDDYFEIATDLFCNNLRRYLSGMRLKNIVHKRRGY